MDDRIQASMSQRKKKKKNPTLVPKFMLVKGNKTLHFFIFSKTNY